jgi:flagellar export protein FliJ
MKTFDQLIRLHRHRLTERQKALVALEAKAAELRQTAAALEAEALAEEAKAGESELGTFGWGAYLTRVRAERERFAAARAEAEQRIGQARALLRAAFEELKRIEIVRDQKLAAAAAAAKKREQSALDEVAISQHRRREV